MPRPIISRATSYRIIFIHVPAAWMSMFLYVVMAFWAGVGLAFNTRLSGMMASAIAPTGAMFTFLALWTGSLWGKPTWGTWWVWDARLTSELILLFLYFGFMALQAAIDEERGLTLYYTTKFMQLLLAGVFAFFGLHTILWLYRSLAEMKAKRARPAPEAEKH